MTKEEKQEQTMKLYNMYKCGVKDGRADVIRRLKELLEIKEIQQDET